MKTKFTISLEEWIDISLNVPLNYKIGYLSKNKDKVILKEIQGLQALVVSDVLLPYGQFKHVEYICVHTIMIVSLSIPQYPSVSLSIPQYSLKLLRMDIFVMHFILRFIFQQFLGHVLYNFVASVVPRCSNLHFILIYQSVISYPVLRCFLCN